MKRSDSEEEFKEKWYKYEIAFLELQKLMFQRFQGSDVEYQFLENARGKLGIEAYTYQIIQLTDRLARAYDFLKSTKGKNFGTYHQNALIDIAIFSLYTIITLREDSEKKETK